MRGHRTHVILVGNFGDGHINAFDTEGNWAGPLKDDGRPIVIEGLWALENNVPATDTTQLFFTAGPFDESNGRRERIL